MANKKTFMQDLDNTAELFISKPAEKPAEAPETAKEEAPEGYHINPLYVENKSRRLQLLVKPSTVEKLRSRAKQNGTSVNDLVNTILEEALRED